jgi:hypothetical protein
MKMTEGALATHLRGARSVRDLDAVGDPARVRRGFGTSAQQSAHQPAHRNPPAQAQHAPPATQQPTRHRVDEFGPGMTRDRSSPNWDQSQGAFGVWICRLDLSGAQENSTTQTRSRLSYPRDGWANE